MKTIITKYGAITLSVLLQAGCSGLLQNNRQGVLLTDPREGKIIFRYNIKDYQLIPPPTPVESYGINDKKSAYEEFMNLIDHFFTDSDFHKHGDLLILFNALEYCSESYEKFIHLYGDKQGVTMAM